MANPLQHVPVEDAVAAEEPSSFSFPYHLFRWGRVSKIVKKSDNFLNPFLESISIYFVEYCCPKLTLELVELQPGEAWDYLYLGACIIICGETGLNDNNHHYCNRVFCIDWNFSFHCTLLFLKKCNQCAEAGLKWLKIGTSCGVAVAAALVVWLDMLWRLLFL